MPCRSPWTAKRRRTSAWRLWRLDRMAAEVERVGDAVTAHLPVGEASASAK